MSKPSIPQGTRDFSPQEVAKRNYIFDTIRSVFVKYGFQPIETPTLENLSTLTGKYGDEGDQLLFKVLNNGDFLQKANKEALADLNSARLVSSICDRGLRYDLTVPFARYVVMHQNEITFPFKRYQIQPVWRADRPQRGRYREFYQCDADVVGSTALTYEADFVQIYNEVFEKLNLGVTIKINNRKILEGIAEAANCHEQLTTMTVAIDKLDKIGIEGVKTEMLNRQISPASVAKIVEMLACQTLQDLAPLFENSPIGLQGIAELEKVFSYLDLSTMKNTLQFDITLARGLSYYTGCILEIKANEVAMGSIGGGGRYEDLTAIFGLKNMSGVGISFGLDRIYDCLAELNLFPEKIANNQLAVLIIAFDEATHHFGFSALRALRKANIASEIYPEPLKLQKQMKYANDRGVAYTLLIGEEEMQSGLLTFKNMTSGEQEKLRIGDIIQKLES